MARFDFGAELDVLLHVELVRDIVEILQDFRLARKAFFPAPFCVELLGEVEDVDPRFTVRSRAGISVPIPSGMSIGGLI